MKVRDTCYKRYVWCPVNREEKIVIYCYGEGSCSRDTLKNILGDRQLKALQSDGYNVYMYLEDRLYNTEHLCCLAHARAKLVYAYEQGGDLNTFRNWVQQNVRFPQIALENGIQGRVVLTFVIEKDGRLTNIEVLQTPDRSLSEEAIRVLNKSPKWSPGKQRNQPVRVKYTLPVDFRVAN